MLRLPLVCLGSAAVLLVACGGGGSSNPSPLVAKVTGVTPTDGPTATPTTTPQATAKPTVAPKPTSTPTAKPKPTATPTAGPTLGPVLVAPSSLSFAGVGRAAAKPVTVSQANGNAPFRAAGCAGVATASIPANGTFTVTPAAAGTCTFTISGGGGMVGHLAVTVTTTSIVDR